MVKWQDLQNVLEGKRRKPNAATTATTLTIGAVMGAASGILFAPKSGKKTRAQLMQKVKEGRDKSKEKADEAKDATKEKVNKTTIASKAAVEEGKQAVNETKKRANNSSSSKRS